MWGHTADVGTVGLQNKIQEWSENKIQEWSNIVHTLYSERIGLGRLGQALIRDRLADRFVNLQT